MKFLNSYKQSVLPPYNRRDLPLVLGTLFLLLMIPVTSIFLSQRNISNSNASLASVLEPEDGVVSSGVNVGNDTLASGSKFIRFAMTPTDNMLTNPGFEADSTSWTAFQVATIDTTNANSGTKAVKLGNEGYVSQSFTTLTPNSKYTVTAWGKVTSGEIGYLGVTFWNASNVKNTTYKPSATFSTTSYTMQSISFTVPSDATRSEVWVYKGTSDGTFYADDISLFPDSGATPTATAAPVVATPTPVNNLTSYYVSPNGSDTNDGKTTTTPWKTFRKAVATLTAGQQAIFEDGTYNESTEVQLPRSGTSVSSPIVFKARNKHKAIIYFSNRVDMTKINLAGGISYVTFQDLEITQNAYGTKVTDALIRAFGTSTNISLIGNKIHKAYELIKSFNGKDYLVDGNIFYDTDWGIGWTVYDGVTIRNNEFYQFRQNAIQTKMNNKNSRVYNNYVHSGANNSASDWAIELGGNSCGETSTATCGNSDPSGYENWGSVAYNNVITVDAGGSIAGGIALHGCYKCAAFNNVVIGVTTPLGALLGGAGGNWTRRPQTVDPVYRNNILKTCNSGFNSAGLSGTAILTNNIFFNCPAPTGANISITNTVTTDPLLTSDWHVSASSPAIGKGVVVSFTNYEGVSLNSELKIDKAGKTRTEPWDIGVFESN